LSFILKRQHGTCRIIPCPAAKHALIFGEQLPFSEDNPGDGNVPRRDEDGKFAQILSALYARATAFF
jgi:hypothetical protein